MTKKIHIPQQCIIRLQKEYVQIQREEIPNISCVPKEDNILEWHYVIHGLTEQQSTSFYGGTYHGKLVFSPQYPYKPPSIYMCTPNGRFQINQRICTSMSDFHPESWRPLWSIRSILIGLLSFFLDEKEPQTYGSVQTTLEEKRRYALCSMQNNMKNDTFRDLFPQFVEQYKQKLKQDEMERQQAAAAASANGNSTSNAHATTATTTTTQQQRRKALTTTTTTTTTGTGTILSDPNSYISTMLNVAIFIAVAAFILYIVI